jgi:CRP/FNR family cyclic AMP-dependent transcriptional regulator
MTSPPNNLDQPVATAPLLSGLGEDDRRRVIDACIRRRFRRGEVLFSEGDPAGSMHFLISGFLVIQVTTPFGDVATMNAIGAPDTVGELALLNGYGRRSASVLAITPAETLALNRGAFERLCGEHPVVEHMLVTILSAHVRRLSDRLTEALYLPAEIRVLLRLADLARLFGGANGRASIPMTHSDLAAMAGTTRPTVNRALHVAQTAGAISLGRGRIDVIKADVLGTLVADRTARERRDTTRNSRRYVRRA